MKPTYPLSNFLSYLPSQSLRFAALQPTASSSALTLDDLHVLYRLCDPPLPRSSSSRGDTGDCEDDDLEIEIVQVERRRQCHYLWGGIRNTTDDEDPERSTGTARCDTNGNSNAKKGGKLKKKRECPNSRPNECKEDPQCLNWLGQNVWEDDNAFKKYCKVRKVKYNSQSERDSAVPAGLKNLGATCYANSLLQTWYHDPVLLHHLYSVVPPPSSALGHLQDLFVSLSLTIEPYVNPSAFIKRLSLDEREQQDAQEFAKLFMGLVEVEFRRVGAGEVMKKQFEGELVYGTKCQRCGGTSERRNNFMELEINLKPKCQLLPQLTSVLSPEHLTGDNQYHCSVCNQKVDATRYTKLTRLPPVLHFSIVRFCYDVESGERRKRNLTINFPEEVDLSEFIDSNDGIEEAGCGQRYRLTGILSHLGKSAHHGHYVAEVFDRSKNQWFLFDDECVQPADFRGSNEDQPTLFDEEEMLMRSKHAYMLVYTRVDENFGETIEIKLPEEIAMRVEERNELWRRTIEEEKSLKEKTWTEFEEKREAKRKMYQSWNSGLDDPVSIFMKTSDLEKWTLDGFEPVIDAEEYGKNMPEPDDGAEVEEEIMCPHDKMNPKALHLVKILSKDNYMNLVKAGATQAFKPIISSAPENLCKECAWEIAADNIYTSRHKPETERFNKVNKSDASVYISKPWLIDWKKSAPSTVHILGSLIDRSPQEDPYIGHVICHHGGVTPNQKTRMLISQEGSKYLQVLFPNWIPLTKEDDEVCTLCEEEGAREKEMAKMLKEQAVRERSMTTDVITLDDIDNLYAGVQYYLLPPEFLGIWRRWIKLPNNTPRPAEVDLTPLMCTHGGLIVDLNHSLFDSDPFVVVEERTWKDFLSKYPASDPVKVWKKLDSTIASEPSPCSSGCIQARLTNFSTTTIKVRLLRSIFDPSTDWVKLDPSYTCYEMVALPSSGSEEPPRNENFAFPSSIPSSNGNGKRKISDSPTLTRRSKRIKTSYTISSARDLIKKTRYINVDKMNTVRDIKVKIDEIFGVPTIYQRIFLKTKEVENNELTVEELGMTFEDKLDVIEVQVDEEDAFKGSSKSNKPNVNHNNEKTVKKGEEEKEEGFGGTGLYGYEWMLQVECGRCTLINLVQKGAKDVKCEACEGPLVLENC